MILQRFLIVLSLVLWCRTAYAKAEPEPTAAQTGSPTLCNGELRYQWVRTGETEPQIITFMSLQAKGATAEEARSEVLRLLESSNSRALESCKAKHENFSGCVSAKMSSNATLMNSLGFAAKKALQDAIVEDCKSQVGVCSLVKAEDPKCVTIEIVSTDEASAEQEEPKKGDKKK